MRLSVCAGGSVRPHFASIVRLALQATLVTTGLIINAHTFASNFLWYLGFWIVDLNNCVAHGDGQLTGGLRIRLAVPPIVYLSGAYQGSGEFQERASTTREFSQTIPTPTTVIYYRV